jgi:hypothetical protein
MDPDPIKLFRILIQHGQKVPDPDSQYCLDASFTKDQTLHRLDAIPMKTQSQVTRGLRNSGLFEIWTKFNFVYFQGLLLDFKIHTLQYIL